MSFDYQAIVLGGGPSGARVATRLAAGGASVLLLEAEGPDVDNLCSGLLNPEGQAALASDLPAHVPREPFRPRLEFHDADNRLRYRYDPRYWNMDRPSFDAWLRECAADAGAQVEYHRRASRITLRNRGAGVRVGGDELSCAVLIDATGWRALGRKLVGAGAPPVDLRASAASRRALPGAAGAERARPEDHAANNRRGAGATKSAPHVHAFQGVVVSDDLPADSMWAVFHSATTPYYGWLVPKGQGRFLLGAGYPQGAAGTRRRGDDARVTDADPWRKLAFFADYIAAQGYRIEPVEDKPLGCPITTITATRQLWWGTVSVVPCGEAAGLVSPSSGDGIHFGLEHANALAAELLAGDALRAGLDSADHAQLTARVQRRLSGALGELRFNCLKARVASSAATRGLAARLLPLYLRRPVERLRSAA